MKKITMLLLALTVSTAAWAAVPSAINFQGRLVDDGTLVSGTVSLQLKVYDAATDGTLLYVDSNTVSVVDGMYSTLLGDDTATFGDFAAALDSVELWVEAEVDGQVLAPRFRISSAPYALRSADAETLGGQLPSAYATGTPVYAESDPVYAASPAAGIGAQQVTDWDAAHGWGDHGEEGYLTSETDPHWAAESNNVWRRSEEVTNAFDSQARSTASVALATAQYASNTANSALLRTVTGLTQVVTGEVRITSSMSIGEAIPPGNLAGIDVYPTLYLTKQSGRPGSGPIVIRQNASDDYDNGITALGYGILGWGGRASLWLGSMDTSVDGVDTNRYENATAIYFGRGPDIAASNNMWTISSRYLTRPDGHDEGRRFSIFQGSGNGTLYTTDARFSILPDGGTVIARSWNEPDPVEGSVLTVQSEGNADLWLRTATNAGAMSWARFFMGSGTNSILFLYSDGQRKFGIYPTWLNNFVFEITNSGAVTIDRLGKGTTLGGALAVAGNLTVDGVAVATGTPVYAETDPVWAAEKSGYATGTPVYAESDPVFSAATAAAISAAQTSQWSTAYGWGDHGEEGYLTAETDPVYSADKANIATGTPVYVESDPIYSADKANIATGTPIYVESDPLAVLVDGSRAMTGDLDMGGNSITNVADGSIQFADGTALSSTGVGNWNTAYGWGDHGEEGYLTTETDPEFTASPAAGILNTDINSWNDAAGWGDHGEEGYLTAETDPVYSADKANIATGTPVYVETDPHAVLADGSRAMTGDLDMGGNSITNVADGSIRFADGTALSSTGVGQWNTAYGWGDHGEEGYLTTETDPEFTASPAAGILNTDINSWNDAAGWGDHGEEGYLTSETDPEFTASPAAGIGAQQVTDWDTAYGWGDHGEEGYLTAETDPVYSADKANIATGTPVYVETDPNAVLADGSRAMTGDLDMGGNSITNVADGSIRFADGTALSSTGVGQWNTAYGWGDHGAEGYISGADATNSFVKKSGDTMSGALTVQNAIVVGSNSVAAAAGMVRFNPASTNFEGYTGTEWVSLTPRYAP